MKKYLVGIDAGTMGGKTCIFDLDGKLISYDYQEYPIYFPADLTVEQDLDEVAEGLYTTVRNALEKGGVDPEEIIAIGISTQGGAITFVDADGKQIGRSISWMDNRCALVDPDTSKYIDPAKYYELEGWSIRGLVMPGREYLWLRENKPELFDEAAHIVTHQEYILRKFGVDGYFTDPSSACREGTAVTETGEFSEEIHNAFGIDLNKRGKVVANGTVVGYVTEEVSAKCGLAVGTPVCVGALDQDCSTFGAGMITPGDTGVVMGTFGACYVCSDKNLRDDKERLIVKMHTRFDDNKGPTTYTMESMTLTSASSFKWYRDAVGTTEKAEAEATGEDAYTVLARSAAESVPGANGVTFLPYLGGCMLQNWPEIKGSFIGITMATQRADLTRAVMEGIVYETYDMIKTVEETGAEIGDIVLAGGPTKSEFWCQMQADIYQRRLVITESPETGCLGAALYAGVGAGAYKDAYEAVKKAVHVKKVYEPNPDNAEAYEAAFRRYKAMGQAIHEANLKLQ